MPSKNDFFFTLKKCQAKLVSVRLNEMKICAQTLKYAYPMIKT